MNRINGELKCGETAPSPGIDCYIPKDNSKGGHGLGLNTSFTWAADCMRWVEDITQQERSIFD